jgi:hypothetical protein
MFDYDHSYIDEYQDDRDERAMEITSDLIHERAIDSFNVGDTFTLKSHKDSVYRVEDKWTGQRSGETFIRVTDLAGQQLASTAFTGTNIEDFARRGEIVREVANVR